MPRKYNCRSFPYSASAQAEVLILGSMPGQRSLEEQEYYAHPQNLFWDIMGDSFGAGRQLEYKKRLETLIRHRIALWDVAFQCRRNGSLDAKIQTKTVTPNDFKKFFDDHPLIHTVLFNGQKAEQLFKKLVLKDLHALAQRLKYVRLPSTSPAHASMTKRAKCTLWCRHLTGLMGKQVNSSYCHPPP